jgi:hypothetical protein
MGRIMKNHELLIERNGWCFLGGGDLQLRAPPGIRVSAISAELLNKPIEKTIGERKWRLITWDGIN